MSINEATPQDWDRLRKQHPPLEVPKRTIDETLMKVYLDMVEAELNTDTKQTEGHKQHVERKKLEEFNDRWGSVERWNSVYTFGDKDEEDAVNNPDHYNTGNIECIEAIEESMSSVAFKGYLKGNCIKYLWRYDYKGKQVEDLEKAGWYLLRLTDIVIEENS